MKHLPGKDGTGGDITIAGFDKLKALIIKDPQSASETAMQTQAFKVIKRQLSGEDELAGFKDPKGEELFSRALPKLYKALEDGQQKGLTIGELTDPENPNWIGNSVQSLKRSQTQMSMDMLNASGEAVGETATRTFGDIYKDYKAATDPARKAELRKEAEDLGLVRKSNIPAIP